MKVCRTSSAQMMTFDIRHPDIEEFITAKRQDGRLRQFNLSALVTKQFMEAVKDKSDWKLVFPLHYKEKDLIGTDGVVWEESWPLKDDSYTYNEAGQVACKVYKIVKAQDLWDLIMKSTYDFAEPGFILIDEINRLNNNWFCEDVRATNPLAI
jgi:ribonucleoside-diphosphate reductase alpha chain